MSISIKSKASWLNDEAAHSDLNIRAALFHQSLANIPNKKCNKKYVST
jgi:hypothetical protein